MSVTTETNRTTELTTDGVVYEFDFSLLIYDKSEIEVWYQPTDGNYSQLTLDTDYGVIFTEDGGTVSTDGYTAPLAAGKLLIIRHLELTQQTNWLYNDNHTGQQHQDDFDRGCIRDIQLQEQLDRCPKFPTHSSTEDITFPEPVANMVLAYNSSGDDLTLISPSAAAGIPEYLNDLLDVTITTPVANNILNYNGSIWVNTDSPTFASVKAYVASGTALVTAQSDDGFAQMQLSGVQTTDTYIGVLSYSNAGDSIAQINAMRAGANDAADLVFKTQATGGVLTTRLTISSTGNFDFESGSIATLGALYAGVITGHSFKISSIAGDIGVATDTDLLQLAANLLTVNGAISATGILKVDTIGEYTSAQGVTIDGVVLKDGIVTGEHIIISNPTPILVFKDSTYVGDASLGYIEWRDLNNTRLGFFGNSSSGNDDLLWKNESSGGHIGIQTTGEGEVQISANALTVNGTVTATSLTLTAPSSIRVNLSEDQVIPTGEWTKLLFATEDWDVKGEFADYKFTPVDAGYYQVNLTVYMIGLLNGKMAISRIYKNGDPYSEARVWMGAGGSVSACVSDIVYLDGDTDYVEGYIYHNNGDNKSAESLSYQTFMSIHRLS